MTIAIRDYWQWFKPVVRWACLLGVSLLPIFVWNYENFRPFVGIVYQCLGFGWGYLQLHGALERFKPPRIRDRLRAWFEAWPRSRVIQISAVGSTVSSGSGAGPSVSAASPTLDQRVQELESVADILRGELATLRADGERVAAELRAALGIANSTQTAAVEGVAETLAAHAAGEIEYQWLALYWAAAGLALSVPDATWRFVHAWATVVRGSLML